MFPEKLNQKLIKREASNSLRHIDKQKSLIDFYSNDYLGFASSETIFDKTHQVLLEKNIKINGATGSRLISGNHDLYREVESFIANFHNAEKALIFNSGYDANVGFFSSVPQRGDVILYDELSHASIRDGIQLSNAKAYKFKHNDCNQLEALLKRHTEQSLEKRSLNGVEVNQVYVVTESIFSMDGDAPNLVKMTQICKKHNAYLVVDEAHALGVFGEKGTGLIQELQLEKEVFARIVTFGKGLGCHGAVILGSEKLVQYLVNFARSFIYTTGLSPHSIATIKIAYEHLQFEVIQRLQDNIKHFKIELERLQLADLFIESNSAIHCCVISGNDKTKAIAISIQEKGFNIKPILSPTVAEGKERLRFCLHAFDNKKEITKVLEILNTLL